MFSVRYLLAALSASSLLLTMDFKLRTGYAEGRTVRVSSETTLALETTAFEVSVAGEPIERPVAGGGTYATSIVRTSERVDRVLAAEGGRPVGVRRAYEQLSNRVETSFAEVTSAGDRACPLDAITLELARDGARVTATVVEGTAPSEPSLLEGHRLELGLDALLPAGEVEQGASWRISSASARRALGLEGGVVLFPEPPIEESPEGTDRKSRRRFRMYSDSHTYALRVADWEGTATFVAAEEGRGGSPSARIRVELRAAGDLPITPGETVPAGTYAVQLGGELLFDLEAALPVRLELSGKLTERRVRKRDVRGTEMLVEATLEGPLTHVVEVSTVDD
jgi:hypothetical protein